MPLYSLLCRACGNRDAMFRRIAERDERIPACDCGHSFERVIDAPFVRPDITPYVSPSTGKLIGSRSARREDLERAGCIEWEPGIDKAIAKRREESFERVLASVDEKVDNVVRDFAASGRL